MCPHHTLETCSSELWRTLWKLGSHRADSGLDPRLFPSLSITTGVPRTVLRLLLLFQARSPERCPPG